MQMLKDLKWYISSWTRLKSNNDEGKSVFKTQLSNYDGAFLQK